MNGPRRRGAADAADRYRRILKASSDAYGRQQIKRKLALALWRQSMLQTEVVAPCEAHRGPRARHALGTYPTVVAGVRWPSRFRGPS